MMKKAAILLIIIVCTSFAGKYVAEFTEIGISARASGMGSGFIATKGGTQSQFYNPAGLTDSRQGYLMHSMLYDNLFSLDAGVFTYPVSKLNMGLAVARFATDDIPFTRDDGFYDWGTDGIPGTHDIDGSEGNGIKDPGEPVRPDALDYESEADYLILLGASYPVLENLDLGLNFKYIKQDIGGYKADGFGIDLGAIYALNSKINLGLALRDAIGTSLKWSTDFSETKLPTLELGGSYLLDIPVDKSDICFSLSLENKFENAPALIEAGKMSIDPHIGVELTLYDLLQIRTGLDREDFSAGAGIMFKGFNVDYAFLGGELDNTHRIGITVTFPEPRPSEPEIVFLDTVVHTPEPEPEPELIEEPEPTIEIVEVGPEKGTALAEIYFEIGMANLDKDDEIAIEDALDTLKKYENISVIILGHTDKVPIATDEFPNNLRLSEARADIVKAYLMAKGISESRIKTSGFAAQKQKYSGNESFKNRRVEILVD